MPERLGAGPMSAGVGRLRACPPCADTGEFPPNDGDVCGWCDGDGEVPAEVAERLIEARRNYQARRALP